MDHKLDDYLDKLYAQTPELSDGDAASLARGVGFICSRHRFLQYAARKRQLEAVAAAAEPAVRKRRV
jgi:hypothetical protein